MKKNKFLIGSVILLLASLITKFLGAFYKIPLTKILGTSGLGVYQMIYPIFALFVMLASSGLVVAISKSVAVSKNHKNKIKLILKSGFFIAIVFSIFLTFVFALLSPILAAKQGDKNFVICYLLILPCILLGGICAVFRGYFFGNNKMVTNGVAQIIEQFSKIIFAIMFAKVFFELGIVWTVGGALLGITTSEVIVTAFYFFNFKRQSKTKQLYKKVLKCIKKIVKPNQVFFCKTKKLCFWQMTKHILTTSFFVTIQASILPLVSAIDGVIITPQLIKNGISNQVAYTVFGLSAGIVSSIISLPLVVASSIGSAIIPNIQNENKQSIAKKISFAIKIVWLAGIAFCAVILIVPNQILSFLFAGSLSTKFVDEFQICSDLLRISCFGSLYLCLLTISTSILQGLGKSQTPAINLFVSAIIRFAILFVLFATKSLSIYAIAISDIAFYGLAFALNLFAIKKQAKIAFALKKIFVWPVLSAGLMIFAILLSKNIFSNLLSPKALTITICSCGLLAYLVGLVLTKTIDLNEIYSYLSSEHKKRLNLNKN